MFRSSACHDWGVNTAINNCINNTSAKRRSQPPEVQTLWT
jgi:hypothetical protein